MPEVTAKIWGEFISACPEAHILQTGLWGKLKAKFGWDVAWVLSNKDQPAGGNAAGVQILFRNLPLGYSMAYIPKGPVGGNKEKSTGYLGWDAIWPEVDELCHRRKAIFLKVEPDLFEPLELIENPEGLLSIPMPQGFTSSVHSIQPLRTILVDLSVSEAQILARMKQKTRYNIRLAGKKGIKVIASSDVETFHRMLIVTGARDGFGVHRVEYYREAYRLFEPEGQCQLFLASFNGEPVAGLMAFARGSKSWYFYGASTDQYRDLMPNYALQWEAMRWARSLGCTIYDMWGVPDFDLHTLEANYAGRSGGLWGVYRFKRGFGGKIHRSAGPWDRIYQPTLYTFYRFWMQMHKTDEALGG
jgi:peptidoglycan pentaglycine glycine transferase (the first glycine)